MSSRWLTGALVIGLGLTPLTKASAIPAFARRYRVSCQVCHNPIPALTAFGEQFAANGYRMAAGESAPDTIDTGDPDLTLLRNLPLAVRLDAYAQAYANGKAVTDFQSPYVIKVLSGGALSKTISYYFYTYLTERGEIAGVEDASLIFNDLGGRPVDVAIGQFQASDPIFKSELRLTFEDYAVYRARVGAVPVDLTYDRGLMASAEVGGFTVTGELLNGNGIGEAEGRQFDNDGYKNVLLHATRDVAGGLRLGAFGYFGRSGSDGVRNETTMVGVDGTLALAGGTVEINGQYVHRRDDHPTYAGNETASRLNGGFAELLIRPDGSRWHGFVLYNRVDANLPVLDVRMGGPAEVRRYQTVSAGVGRLLRRNVKWTTEGSWDFELEAFRWTVGFVTAF